MSPAAYAEAMERVRAAIVEAAVTVDIVDVGGGFPSIYPGMEPPPLEAYFEVIHAAFESLPISYSAELWCEPGRALCAEYASVLVRVEKRRGDELYINDGAYGALFDAAHIGWRFPVKLLREAESETRDMPFSFYGPTCDDLDHMAGPFMLPADVQAGDYIEIGMLGAYGCAMRTGFNGFGSDLQGDRRGRADGDALWRRRGTGARRRTSSSCNALQPCRPSSRRRPGSRILCRVVFPRSRPAPG